MFMTVFRDREARDGETGEKAVVPAGRHAIECIGNPFDPADEPWFVLKGTLIGGAVGYWRGFVGGGWFGNEVILEIEE